MRTSFDFSPFARSTVGFDRMLRLLDGVPGAGDAPSYPPYNIIRTAEDEYEIAVAVAGFGEDELEVKLHDGQLTVKSTPDNGHGGHSGEGDENGNEFWGAVADYAAATGLKGRVGQDGIHHEGRGCLSPPRHRAARLRIALQPGRLYRGKRRACGKRHAACRTGAKRTRGQKAAHHCDR